MAGLKEAKRMQAEEDERQRAKLGAKKTGRWHPRHDASASSYSALKNVKGSALGSEPHCTLLYGFSVPLLISRRFSAARTTVSVCVGNGSVSAPQPSALGLIP